MLTRKSADDLFVLETQSENCAGAGTLGCEVARTLMAWGVHDVHFVDNGRVVFSNPARQSLFVFDDCLDGGKLKAEAAAEAVRRINPSVRSGASCISIAMPGHPPAPSEMEQTRQVRKKKRSLTPSGP